VETFGGFFDGEQYSFGRWSRCRYVGRVLFGQEFGQLLEQGENLRRATVVVHCCSPPEVAAVTSVTWLVMALLRIVFVAAVGNRNRCPEW
jgi:hypothetical protein